MNQQPDRSAQQSDPKRPEPRHPDEMQQEQGNGPNGSRQSQNEPGRGSQGGNSSDQGRNGSPQQPR